MLNAGEISRVVEGLEAVAGPDVANGQTEPSSGTLDTASVVDVGGLDKNRNWREWRTWRRERAGVLAAIEELRQANCRLSEEIRSLRAVVVGYEAVGMVDRQRALWIRQRLSGTERIDRSG